MALDALKKFCVPVDNFEPTGIVEALRAVEAWVCRAPRYQLLVQRNQEVNEALANILEDNSQVYPSALPRTWTNGSAQTFRIRSLRVVR